MNVPDKEDSASDVSSNSSWTVLDENETITNDLTPQNTEDASVIEPQEVFEHVERPEETSFESECEEQDSDSMKNDDDQDAVDVENGFLTLEEFVQQRELEYDYGFDGKVEHFESILKKSDSKTKNKRKKSKAGHIGTLSVIGTVLAVTGLSFLCLLTPGDNPSASAAANIKSKLPKFSEVKNSVSYTCPVYQDENDTALKIIDEGGFLKEILNKSKQCRKNQPPKLTKPVGPLTREDFLKKPAGVPKISNIEKKRSVVSVIPPQQNAHLQINETNKNKKDTKFRLNETKTANRNHLPSTSQEKRKTDIEKAHSNPNVFSPLLGSDVAHHICQDLILFKMFSSLRKVKTFSQLEKLMREKRKHVKKESVKKERKNSRLLKVRSNYSTSDLECQKCERTNATLKCTKDLKQITVEKNVIVQKTPPNTDRTPQNKISKTNNLKVNIDLRHLPPIPQRNEKPTYASVLLNAGNSKQKKLETENKNGRADSHNNKTMQMDLDKKKLKEKYEDVKKKERIYETAVTSGSITFDQKLESLQDIRKARESFIECLKHNREEFKKRLLQNKKHPKNISSQEQQKSVATSYYKFPEIDNNIICKKLSELRESEPSYKFPFCHTDTYDCECRNCESDKVREKRSPATDEHAVNTYLFQTYHRRTKKSKKSKLSERNRADIAQETNQNLTTLSKSGTDCLQQRSKVEQNSDSTSKTKKSDSKQGKIKLATEIPEKFVIEKEPANKRTELTETNTKHVLDNIIKEAIKETRKSKQRKSMRFSASETDVNHADDEMSSSNTSLNFPSEEERTTQVSLPSNSCDMVVAKKSKYCRNDLMYYWLFGEKGKEIIKKDRARWLLKNYPSMCHMKQITKQDPSKCYVHKVTK